METQKQVLVEAFGDEVGQALFGAAVKMSNHYGIAEEDVVGEMVIEALDVQAQYGHCHVNVIVNHTRNALNRNPAYGVNTYYHFQGVSEISADQENDDGDRWIEAFPAGDSWQDVDLSLDIAAQIEALGDLEQGIARGFAAGLSNNDIAEQVGCHYSTVSKKKAELAQAFAWVM